MIKGLHSVKTVSGTGTSSSSSSLPRPPLKVGIVLPRQIFKQRLYQRLISDSFARVAGLAYGSAHEGRPTGSRYVCMKFTLEGSKFNFHKRGRRRRKRYTRRRGGGLGVGTVRKPAAGAGRRRFRSVLDRVREAYDFRWDAGAFQLLDPADSINFGDLVVSPPPSGLIKCWSS